MSERPDVEGLGREVGEIWDRNAEYWDLRMGEGNAFHSELVQPSQERLLDLRAGDLVLDVACGNGQFARQMARLGARVVAFDISARMIELARGRTRDDAARSNTQSWTRLTRKPWTLWAKSVSTQPFVRWR